MSLTGPAILWQPCQAAFTSAPWGIVILCFSCTNARRDYLLDILSWIRNALNDLWDYLAQVSLQTTTCTNNFSSIHCRWWCHMSPCVVQQARPVDVVKKDDDLWSPRHSSSQGQPFFTGAWFRVSLPVPLPASPRQPSLQHIGPIFQQCSES